VLTGMKVIRARLKKGEEARFISHLDFTRAVERAARRACVPLVLSEGYNPHPRLSFGPALPVGTTSDAEYVDFYLDGEISAAEFARRLKPQLPPGLSLVEAREVWKGSPSLTSLLDTASYRVQVPVQPDLSLAGVEEAVQRFLAQEEIEVTRLRKKKGLRRVNIRPGIFSVETVELSGGRLVFDMKLVTGSLGTVRPEEVIEALASFTGWTLGKEGRRVHRTGLYCRRDGRYWTPMEKPHSAAGSTGS